MLCALEFYTFRLLWLLNPNTDLFYCAIFLDSATMTLVVTRKRSRLMSVAAIYNLFYYTRWQTICNTAEHLGKEIELFCITETQYLVNKKNCCCIIKFNGNRWNTYNHIETLEWLSKADTPMATLSWTSWTYVELFFTAWWPAGIDNCFI